MKVARIVRFAWSAERILAALKERSIGEQEKFVVLLLGQMLLLIQGYIGLFVGIVPDRASVLFSVVLILLNASGITLTYCQNGGGQGRDFIERFFLLFLPISMRLFLIGWPLFYFSAWLLMSLIKDLPFAESEVILRGFEFLWHVGLTVFLYWRVSFWLRRLRAQ